MPQNAAAAQSAIAIVTTLSTGDDGAMTPNGGSCRPRIEDARRVNLSLTIGSLIAVSGVCAVACHRTATRFNHKRRMITNDIGAS